MTNANIIFFRKKRGELKGEEGEGEDIFEMN